MNMQIEAKKREYFNAAFAQLHRAAELSESMNEHGVGFERGDSLELNRLARAAHCATEALEHLCAGGEPPKLGDAP